MVGFASVIFAMVLGIGLGLVSGYVGGRLDTFIMRVADIQLSFPAILIALLIDGIARGVLPRDMHQVAIYVLIFAIGLSGLGAVCPHGARLDAGREEQGIRAGGPLIGIGQGDDHAGMCCPT
jgi:hypothetical protein